MTKGARVAASVAAVLVLGAGGYGAADAYDVVPGLVTLAPVPPVPTPFPTAPALAATPDEPDLLDELDPEAPVPPADTVQQLARALASDPRMGTSVGVVVADALTGETLADVDGATPRAPASTSKLLTALAALTALGPDRTLPTTVVEAAPGSLVLVGGGDMMLAARAGDPESVNGRAGMGDLAAQVATELRAAGITQVTLAVDDTLFTGPTVHPGWNPDDVAAGYAAPVTAVAVDVARTVTGAEYPPRFPDPSLHAAQVLATLLTEDGFTVAAPVHGLAPAGARELGRVESAPIREVARLAVQTSDNSVTEALGRLVAVERGFPATFEGATGAVLAELDAEGVERGTAVLADCSGLAAGSALPTRLLVDLLATAVDDDRPELRTLAVDLPVGGWQGTLADRFLAGPAQGLVRAKTGSLPGVTSLAGTLQTESGRLLVFAVLADRTPPGGQPRPRAAIDAFVQQVAAL